MGVREPAAYGEGMLWMEDVGGGRIVDNDSVLQVTSELREILDIVALMVVATISEETMMDDGMNVKLVKKRVAILRNGRGKDNNFVEFSNPLHELIHTGPFYDIDVVIRSFNFDGYSEVRLLKQLPKAAVNQSFVQI